MRPLLACVLAAAALAACGDDSSQPTDAPTTDADVDAPTDAAPFVEPTMLSETGLYSDIAQGTVAPGVIEFAPRWMLWSDAAVKRRWIYLPPGTQIDTSDMDFWKFPQGTKFWKEFTRGGTRIETRLLWKVGATDDVSDWDVISFQWNVGQTDATAVPSGVVDDTGHDDIPSRSDCRKCHGPNRNPSVVLGFQALQLDYVPAQSGFPNLASLIADGKLTAPPAGSGVPYFPIPSSGVVDTTTEAALGYLHGNCGGCHNDRSDVQSTTSMQLRLQTAANARVSWMATPTWQFTVDKPTQAGGGGIVIEPGVDPALDPFPSMLYNRLTTNGVIRMPPVGRETVDNTAATAIRDWILSMPVTP